MNRKTPQRVNAKGKNERKDGSKFFKVLSPERDPLGAINAPNLGSK